MAKVEYVFRKKRLSILLSLVVAGTLTVLWPDEEQPPESIVVAEEPVSANTVAFEADASPEALPAPPEPPAPIETAYTVQSGDTLGHIFARLNLPTTTMYKLLEADEAFLRLDDLSPGQQLLITQEGEDQLVTRMQVVIDAIDTLQFTREGDIYSAEMLSHETNIVERNVHGVINGSLSQSAYDAGVSAAEIETIARLFQDKLNFSRDLRAGDTFKMLFDDVYVDDNDTGRSTLKAIVFQNNGRQLAAFLHEDGQYYDETGHSLNRAFLKSPLQKRYRISSHFNPRRLHPVTNRISPHRGTDFATPIGTPTVSISDGVVTRVGNHPLAGKYITIKHTEKYTTRYLHLNRILVRQGQRVSLGEVVAQTGNTGRSTGPHLHFELHSNTVAVNFMKYSLPAGRQLNANQMVAFKQLVNGYMAKLNQAEPDQQLAKQPIKTTVHG